MTVDELTEHIKSRAAELGFAAAGIAAAQPLDDEATRLDEWLGRGLYGEMSYMPRHRDLRIDPAELLPGAAAVVSVLYNYYSSEAPPEGAFCISMYAYGKDYHRVMHRRLKELATAIEEAAPGVATRICIDSAPIMEKAWAMRAGLGWTGKNGCLIAPRLGSFMFLGEIIVDTPLVADQPMTDHCGSCQRCLEACPTGAIIEPYVIDARRCISYLTIEMKEELPDEMQGKYTDWIFGCDVCQQACPFNRFSTPHDEPHFMPAKGLFDMTDENWRRLTRRQFDEMFAGSAVKRTGYEGLMRNIRFIDR